MPRKATKTGLKYVMVNPRQRATEVVNELMVAAGRNGLATHEGLARVTCDSAGTFSAEATHTAGHEPIACGSWAQVHAALMGVAMGNYINLGTFSRPRGRVQRRAS